MTEIPFFYRKKRYTRNVKTPRPASTKIKKPSKRIETVSPTTTKSIKSIDSKTTTSLENSLTNTSVYSNDITLTSTIEKLYETCW